MLIESLSNMKGMCLTWQLIKTTLDQLATSNHRFLPGDLFKLLNITAFVNFCDFFGGEVERE